MIKNPLTIIGIFASLVEAFGIKVLPELDIHNQLIFMWLLISFAFFLVICFFIILYFKHTVLYAPVDFRSDDSFKEINFPHLSAQEKSEKLQKDLKIIEQTQQNIPHEAHNPAHKVKEQLDHPTYLLSRFLVAKELALLKIGKELNKEINRDIKFRTHENKTVYVDGLIEDSDVITIIKINYLPNNLKSDHISAADFSKYFSDIIYENTKYAKFFKSDIEKSNNLKLLIVFVSESRINNYKDFLNQLQELFQSVIKFPHDIMLLTIPDLKENLKPSY